jgi:hypothetical protein
MSRPSALYWPQQSVPVYGDVVERDRKQVAEPSEDRAYGVHSAPQDAENFEPLASVLKSYCRFHMAIHVHVSLRRRGLEDPAVHTCVGFQRDPKARVVLKTASVRRGQVTRCKDDCAYQMKVPVLVREVKVMNVSQGGSDEGGECIVPSVVRLQPGNRCPFFLPKVLDFFPSLSGTTPRFFPDRKHALFCDGDGDTAAKTSHMELVDQVIEGSPQVMEAVTDEKRPRRVEWFDVSDVEAIFQSVVLSFGSDGAKLAVDPSVKFIYEHVKVVDCSLPLGDWLSQTAAHDLPLEGDGEDERRQADSDHRDRPRNPDPDKGRGLP